MSSNKITEQTKSFTVFYTSSFTTIGYCDGGTRRVHRVRLVTLEPTSRQVYFIFRLGGLLFLKQGDGRGKKDDLPSVLWASFRTAGHWKSSVRPVRVGRKVLPSRSDEIVGSCVLG